MKDEHKPLEEEDLAGVNGGIAVNKPKLPLRPKTQICEICHSIHPVDQMVETYKGTQLVYLCKACDSKYQFGSN